MALDLNPSTWKACILDAGSLGKNMSIEAILEIPLSWMVWASTCEDEIADWVALKEKPSIATHGFQEDFSS